MIYYQDIKHALKQILPAFIKNSFKGYLKRYRTEKKYFLSDIQLEEILINRLKIKKGDVLFLHSSFNYILPENGVMPLLTKIIEVVGDNEGTILVPSYPKESSRDYMRNNEIFNVNSSPSYSGILSEFIRRMPGAKRSLHPTKSVVALGKYANQLIKDHGKSPFPYDENSPYYKIMNYNGKIMGMGLSAEFLTFYHVIEDILKDDFPVDIYNNEIFSKKCQGYDNTISEIRTYCHYMPRVGTKTIKRIERYFDDEYYFNGKISNIPFFFVDTVPFYNKLYDLGKSGHTVYSKSVYRKGNL